jgi:hypothetical protein
MDRHQLLQQQNSLRSDRVEGPATWRVQYVRRRCGNDACDRRGCRCATLAKAAARLCHAPAFLKRRPWVPHKALCRRRVVHDRRVLREEPRLAVSGFDRVDEEQLKVRGHSSHCHAPSMFMNFVFLSQFVQNLFPEQAASAINKRPTTAGSKIKVSREPAKPPNRGARLCSLKLM